MQGDNLRKCFTFRCMTTGDRPVVMLPVHFALRLPDRTLPASSTGSLLG